MKASERLMAIEAGVTKRIRSSVNEFNGVDVEYLDSRLDATVDARGEDYEAACARVLEKLYMTSLRSAPPCAFGVWQPIETAPKDGTTMLLCSSDMDQVVGYYSPNNRCFAVEFNAAIFPATHWMPLPEPPKTGDVPCL